MSLDIHMRVTHHYISLPIATRLDDGVCTDERDVRVWADAAQLLGAAHARHATPQHHQMLCCTAVCHRMCFHWDFAANCVPPSLLKEEIFPVYCFLVGTVRLYDLWADARGSGVYCGCILQ